MSKTFKDRFKANNKVFRSARPHSWYWQNRFNKKRTAKAERFIDKTLCRDLGEDSIYTVEDYELETEWEQMLDWGYDMESWGDNPTPTSSWWLCASSYDYDRFQLEQYNANGGYQ